MRSRLPCPAVVAVTIAVAAATTAARADMGYYQEGGLGTAHARGGLETFEDGGFAVRGGLGYRRAHVGAELMINKAELTLRDEMGAVDGVYTAMTVGPMLTARVAFARTVMDAPFARWWEVYGRLGPTHTWMFGDPGTGAPDGTSGHRALAMAEREMMGRRQSDELLLASLGAVDASQLRDLAARLMPAAGQVLVLSGKRDHIANATTALRRKPDETVARSALDDRARSRIHREAELAHPGSLGVDTRVDRWAGVARDVAGDRITGYSCRRGDQPTGDRHRDRRTRRATDPPADAGHRLRLSSDEIVHRLVTPVAVSTALALGHRIPRLLARFENADADPAHLG